MHHSREHRPPHSRCYRHFSPVLLLGAAMLVLGLLLMFLCIPGWAWAALSGLLLIVAGYALISRALH